MPFTDTTTQRQTAPATGSDCQFCGELESRTLPAPLAASTDITQRFVVDAAHWVAFPSVSPLRIGHVLVVPRRHLCSCAQASTHERAELEAITTDLSERLRTLGDKTLVFEHGIGQGRTGGCGIDHAHLHMVPCRPQEHADAFARLSTAVGPLEVGDTLSGFLADAPADSSYALIGTLDRVACRFSHDVPSQTLRRAVAEAIGCPTWDWRDLTDWSEYETTYAQLA